ncbi:hypothetical protein SAY86_027807 [Trapa natans]|uniref:Uncharacterized protein n=1 Tax=Trapa natans TaxID=22666 RepID=A0AAN7KV73_TRANT|nr:hypothetical protein SAY86_027807 [Trapa natans]
MDRCSKSLLAEEAIKTITESQSLEIKLESEEEPKRPPEAKTETNEKTRQDLLWRPCNQQKIKPQLSRKWSILSGGVHSRRTEVPKDAILQRIDSKKATGSYQLGHQLSPKWSTGAGPRIGCINDYPSEVRHQALEMVSLSPWAQPSSPSAALSPTMELVLSI